MKFIVEWTELATKDLQSIIDYIAIDNTQAAIYLLDDIQNLTEKLDIFPERGRVVPELREYHIYKFRELLHKNWRIFYIVKESVVHILAVLDGRRDLQELLVERLSNE